MVSGVTGANIYLRDLTNNTTSVVSINTTGGTGTGSYPDVNANGRYVTFETKADALTGFTQSPTTAAQQVVIKDMRTGAIQALTHHIGDAGANSIYPSIDCDGHIVAFMSGAALTSDTPWYYNHTYNTFNLYYADVDWSTNPLAFSGAPISSYDLGQPQLSCNGNTAIVGSDRVYISNRLTSGLSSIITSNDSAASVSDDGRYITFTSKTTTLDPSHSSSGRGSNYDVFVKDTKTGTTQLVSFTVTGNMSGLVPTPLYSSSEQLSISPDGSTIAFTYVTPNSTNVNGELLPGVDTGIQDVYTAKTGF